MPFDPSIIFDISIFEAGDIAGNDGDGVSTWSPQSGSSTTAATQATGGFQPLLKKGVNGLNNENIVLFDGIDNLLTFGDLAALDFSTNPFVIYFVIKTADNGKVFFSKDTIDGADNGLLLFTSGSLFTYYNGAAVVNAGAIGADYHLVGYTRAGTGAGGLIPYYDGTAQTPGVESRTFGNIKSATIGATSDQAFFCACSIAAIYIGSAVPNATDRNLFGGYIQDKYGLTIAGATFEGAGNPVFWRMTDIYR